MKLTIKGIKQIDSSTDGPVYGDFKFGYSRVKFTAPIIKKDEEIRDTAFKTTDIEEVEISESIRITFGI